MYLSISQSIHAMNVINARQEFYNVVGSVMDEAIHVELDADFLEDEVEKVLMHLLNGEIPGWDGIINEVFKRYACLLKKPFTYMFQQC